MEYQTEISKPGKYDVYRTEQGERLIVLEGLDPEARVELYPMQQALVPMVDDLIVFYWLLIGSVAAYLIGMYIVAPLLTDRRAKR